MNQEEQKNNEEKYMDENFKNLCRRAEESIWNELNSIRHTVYGNGADGITVKLAFIQKDIESLIKDINNIVTDTDKRSKREWTIILMLLGLLFDTFVKKNIL